MKNPMLSSPEAERIVLQIIVQKKDTALLSTVNQEWFTEEHSNLLITLRNVKHLDYFYCEKFIEQNNIDVSFNVLKNVFKGDIVGELEPALEILENKYLSRKLVLIADNIYDNIGRKNPLNITLDVQKEIQSIQSVSEKIEKLGDNFNIDITDLLYTGIYGQDDLIISRQATMVIGGESGHLKTSYTLFTLMKALQYNILNIGNKDFKVMFFSKEMSFNKLKAKIISNLFRIPYDRIRYNDYDVKEIQSIFMDKYYYYHDNFFLIKAEMFKSEDDMAKYILQSKPDIWALDYIQLLANAKKEQDINREVARIVTNLKSIVTLTNTFGIIISQLRKFGENRISKVPRLEDLYWAGDLRHLADWVGLCYWKWQYDRTKQKSVFFMLWEKNREGATYTTPYKIEAEYTNLEKLPGVKTATDILKLQKDYLV
jgi:replicative DNA helicase